MEGSFDQCDKQNMYRNSGGSTSLSCRVYCHTSIRLINEAHQPYLQDAYSVQSSNSSQSHRLALIKIQYGARAPRALTFLPKHFKNLQ